MVLLHLSVSGAARALPAVSQALGARPWSQSLSASQEETGEFSPHGSRQEALMVPFIRRRLPFFMPNLLDREVCWGNQVHAHSIIVTLGLNFLKRRLLRRLQEVLAFYYDRTGALPESPG